MGTGDTERKLLDLWDIGTICSRWCRNVKRRVVLMSVNGGSRYLRMMTFSCSAYRNVSCKLDFSGAKPLMHTILPTIEDRRKSFARTS